MNSIADSSRILALELLPGYRVTGFWQEHCQGLSPPSLPPHLAALRQQHRVANFVTLLVLSCLHSPGPRCLQSCTISAVTLKHAIWL
jgi:hypothetical protein